MNTHPSWKKKLCILCLCIALLCAGCSQTAQTASSSIGESAVSESTTQSRETYTYSDYELDDSYDESSAALITLSGDSAESNGTGVTISGSTVTISREGCYILRGELTTGRSSSTRAIPTRCSWCWTEYRLPARTAARFWCATRIR